MELEKLDPVDVWLSRISRKYSGSKQTTYEYRKRIQYFFDSVGVTTEQIRDEWHKVKQTGMLNDREAFIEKLLDLVDVYCSKMEERDLSRNSVISRLIAVQSFLCKGLRIPIRIDIPRTITKFHNRDITREEIEKILQQAKPRDRAYFCLLAQSGLRPITASQLRYKHIKQDFESGKIPCKINVPQNLAKGKYRGYFTFVGEETVEYLKQYFETREPLNDDSLLFTSDASNLPEGMIDPHSETVIFGNIVKKLKFISVQERQAKKGKPKSIRMYNLRKWFRNQASPAGREFVHFWMGHVLKNQDEHYLSTTDIEKHRKLYEEKALPNLRVKFIGQAKSIKVLEEGLHKRDEEIKKLAEDLEKAKQQIAYMQSREYIKKIFYEVMEKELQTIRESIREEK